jgi:WD40 repeat protein
LAALGGSVIASGDDFGIVQVWDEETGASLAGLYLAEGVWALGAIGSDRLVIGADCDMLFFSHANGKLSNLLHERTDAHDEEICDIAVYGDRMATASSDMTAKVWCAINLKQLAVLSGHTGSVQRIAFGELYVVTASLDQTVRVYGAEHFQHIREFRIEGPAENDEQELGGYCPVTLAGDHHFLSCARGEMLQITDLRSGGNNGRIVLPFLIFEVFILHNGWVAAAGEDGNAVLFPPPPAAAEVAPFRKVISRMLFAQQDRLIKLAFSVARCQR